MNRPMVLALAVAMASGALPCPAQSPSWVFQPSTYTHDPQTGARVAQYAQVAPVEPLPDPRLVTSGFRRTRSNIFGIDGSSDTSFQVQSFGNGRGGLDAEWERFAEEWRASFLSGSFFNQSPGFGQPGFGQPGFGQPGLVQPGFGQPFLGQPFFGQPFFAPGFGFPGFGTPLFGVPGFFPQPGFVQPGFGRQEFGQPGFRQPGFGFPGRQPARGAGLSNCSGSR